MSAEFIPVVPLSELPAGAMRAVMVGVREILVCHTKEGLFAVDNVCSHAYARLCEGRLRGTICAWPTEDWAARVFPSMDSAKRSPVTDCPARVRPEYANVGINGPLVLRPWSLVLGLSLVLGVLGPWRP